MSSLPITSVTAGSNLTLGQPTVENAAQGVTTSGSNSLKTGQAIVGDGRLATQLNFNLTSNLEATVATSVRFTFDGAQTQPEITAGDSSTFGQPTITNVAQGIFAKGFESDSIGQQQVTSAGITPFYNLNLNVVLTASNAVMLPFYFGGQEVVNVKSVPDTLAFGTAYIKTSIPVLVSGIQSKAVSTNTLVSNASLKGFPLHFNLNTSLVVIEPRRFDFGTLGRPITSAGDWSSSAFGQSTISNVAQGVLSQGFDSSRIGKSIIYFDVLNKGIMLNLGMSEGLKSINSLNVPFYFSVENKLFASGTDNSVFGDVSVRNQHEFIEPSGFIGGIGYPSLSLFIAVQGFNALTVSNGSSVATISAIITPTGINDSAIGNLSLNNRKILLTGFTGLSFGSDTEIDYKQKDIDPSGIDSSVFGISRVEHFLRYLDVLGSELLDFGSTSVDFKNKNITTIGSNHQSFGIPIAAKSLYIEVWGFDSSAFGTRIIPEIQNVYPVGFTGKFGDVNVRNNTQIIAAIGFFTAVQPELRFGQQVVFNSRQYVTQVDYPESELHPPAWSIWQSIENRNKVLQTFGTITQKFGYPNIANNARLISPQGFDSFNVDSVGFIAYRVRYIKPDHIEPFYISGWTVVYNNARLLGQSGINQSSFGNAALLNLNRAYDQITCGLQDGYGMPFIDFRVRTITLDSLHSIEPPYIQLPDVHLYTRYIDVQGTDHSKYGAPDLQIHWTIITPRWTAHELFGVTTFKNVTPEIAIFGHNSEEYGDTHFRLQWRPVAVFGSDSQVFGNSDISYRTKTIYAQGIKQWLVSDKVKLTRIGGLPDPQYVNVISINYADSIQVSTPQINQQVVYVSQPYAFTEFGSTRITANCIYPLGIGEANIGNQSVGLKIRTISPASISDSASVVSRASLSPMTIWCWESPPENAARNNGGSPYEMDLKPSAFGDLVYDTAFGYTTVTNQNRSINVHSSFGDQFGYAQFDFGAKYIYPDGFKMFRMGVCSIPSTIHVEQYDSVDTSSFGFHSVNPPPYLGPQMVQPSGIDFLQWGDNQIDLFNRSISPIGRDFAAFGASDPKDTPYMWQALRIGPLVPVMPVGSDLSSFGTAWISNFIRNISMTGFETFISQYDIQNFEKRMVVKGTPQIKPVQTVGEQGLYATEFGSTDIKLGARYIRPDGNSDQFRKGAW